MTEPSTLNPQPDIETPGPSTLNPRPQLEAGDHLVIERELDPSHLEAVVDLASTVAEFWCNAYLEAHHRVNELLLASHAHVWAAEADRLRHEAAVRWARDTPLDVLVLAPHRRVSVHDFGRAGSVLARDVRGRPEGRPSSRQEHGPR